MPKVGPCCICGSIGLLSFEHVPPRAAYNDQRVFEADIHRLVQGKWDGGSRPLHGQWVDGGAGKETICGRCNELTGHWYGSAYVKWARQALRLVTVSGGALSLAYPYQIYSLRSLKQIVVMFFSACGPGLQSRFSELVRFVLNKYDQHMPCGLRVFSYLLNPTELAAYRQSGMTGVMKYDRAIFVLGRTHDCEHIVSNQVSRPGMRS